jgi:hypothetical protein
VIFPAAVAFISTGSAENQAADRHTSILNRPFSRMNTSMPTPRDRQNAEETRLKVRSGE